MQLDIHKIEKYYFLRSLINSQYFNSVEVDLCKGREYEMAQSMFQDITHICNFLAKETPPTMQIG